MNELIANFVESLKETSAGTKLVAALSGFSLLVIVGLAAVVSSRPAPTPTFFGLNDHDVAAVSKALAEAGIAFQVSTGGVPYTVSVDEDDRSGAFAAAYGAGALDRPLRGISSDNGVASVFNSAEERRQGVRKKEWGEMELMLETLDFVASASVRTSEGRTSPIERNPAPTTASVTLRTRSRLTDAQEDTIARIVSKGLGVAREHLVIADNEGNTLFDGSAEEDGGRGGRDAREAEAVFDSRLASRANGVLDAILGPGKAYVLVNSEWNHEMSTTTTETSTGKGMLLEETSNTTERPVGGSTAGGIAGVSSNVATTDAAGAPGTSRAPAGDTPLEKTSESTKKYAPMLTTENRVLDVPVLRRLSVALFLDEAITPDKAAELEENVKAAVGYDNTRDVFSRASFPTPTLPEATDTPVDGAEPSGKPNPMIDKLLRRGVEIVTALVFVVLLLKSLKSSSRAPEEAAAVGGAESEEDLDVELLARARVDELLKADPDKVGEILSSWARGDELTKVG